MKKAQGNHGPSLWLYALQDLEVGTELRYDYGVPDLPWRQKVQYGPYHYMAKPVLLKRMLPEEQEATRSSLE